MSNEEFQKSFSVLSVTREDLMGVGYPEKVVRKIDNIWMDYIATKMGDCLMDNYWDVLGIVVESILKRKKKD